MQYKDAPNSPWLGDQGYDQSKRAGAALDAFTNLVQGTTAQLRAGPITNFDAVVTDLRNFHKKVINLWATEKKVSGSEAEKKSAENILTEKFRSHYQAVNVEHLTADTPAGERRLELRATGAQTGPQRLHADLDYIYACIEEARQVVRDRLQASAESRSAP